MDRARPGTGAPPGAAHVRARASGTEELQVTMKLTLKIWRQKNTSEAGRFVSYQVDGVTPDMSFLEMLDVLNEQLIERREQPVAFEHDCREGICGSGGLPPQRGARRPPPHTHV